MKGRTISIVAGVVLCAATPFLARARVELSNGLFVGLAVFLIGFFALGAPGVRRANTLLGLWAVAAPFALGYHDRAPGLLSIAAGVTVIVGSLWSPTRATPAPRRARAVAG